MDKVSKDRRVISEVAVVFLLITFFFYQGAFLVVLGGIYGALLYDLYRRTSYGERIREKFRSAANERPND